MSESKQVALDMATGAGWKLWQEDMTPEDCEQQLSERQLLKDLLIEASKQAVLAGSVTLAESLSKQAHSIPVLDLLETKWANEGEEQ